MDFTRSEKVDWQSFYQEYGVLVKSPVNMEGWVECYCPIHPHQDKEGKAAFNVESGHFKCWSPECREKYRVKVGYALESQILTPREFLIVAHGYDKETSLNQVREFKEHFSTDIIPVEHQLSKVYRPKKEWEERVTNASLNLRPDAHIVREYCESRGIKVSTLSKFGVGMESKGDTETLLFPYRTRGIVTAIRVRNSNGGKTFVEGSYAGLYNIDTAIKTGSKSVIIVEGETDCIFLTELLESNGILIPVIATPGAIFPSRFSRDLQSFDSIIYIPQADDAAKSMLTAITKVAGEKLTVVEMPWEPQTWGKDVSDFCRQHDAQKLIGLIGTEQLKITKRVLSGEELMEYANEPVPWIIPELIARGEKTLWVGEPKSMKTWMAIQMADSVINKVPFLGVEEWTPTEDNLRVLLVEEEGSISSVAKRVARTFSGSLDRFKIIHQQSVKIDDSQSLNKLLLDVIALKPDLVILDPFANIHSKDENSATDMRTVLDALDRICRTNGASLVVIHHATKANVRSPRGSSAIWGGFDQMVTVVKNTSGLLEVQATGRNLPEGSTSNEAKALIFDETTAKHKLWKIKSSNSNKEVEEEDEDMYAKATEVKEKLKVMLSISTSEYKKKEFYDAIKPKVNIAWNTFDAILRELEKEGLIEMTGAGRRNDPVVIKWIGD